MTVSDEQLREWEALAAAARPGPWKAKEESIPGECWWIDAPECGVASVGGFDVYPEKDEADARFIASSREAVPALIAALREARKGEHD